MNAHDYGLYTGFLGLVCGIMYSIGGFFVDLFTIGLNGGTALAMGALIVMPAIGYVIGFVTGPVFEWLKKLQEKE